MHSESHLSSRETGYIAANQAVPIEQANKTLKQIFSNFELSANPGILSFHSFLRYCYSVLVIMIGIAS